MKTLKVKLTFTEGLLGTWPNKEDVYTQYIASKAPDALNIEDEVAALGVDQAVALGTTVFARDKNGGPILWDYQLKGFFKDSCSMLYRIDGKDESGKRKKATTESGKLTAYRKIIDGLIFVFPREIPIAVNGEISTYQRSLRVNTAQGERVALANSEEIPSGSSIEIEIRCLKDDLLPAVKEWLDYGALRGLGQWRNASKGRFVWAEIT